MTIRPAKTNTAATSLIAHLLFEPLATRAANDNGLGLGDDRMLWEALRHFAEHGLHAALQAADTAETALEAGDIETFEWWLTICRKLDRPLAERLARMAST